MKTAVIYARYSSEKQTEQSIEGQLRVCHEYAERNDIKIIHEYIDRAMTGKNDNRQDFQKMIKDSSKKLWDYVLVYKLDRFSRNKYETAIHRKTLKDNGVKLLSAMENIPDSPEGIILESLLEGMAEYYSAELSQKVKRGMRETREKGHFTGGKVAYGYKVVGNKTEGRKMIIDEEEANIVKYIYEQYACGRTVEEIIKSLHQKGFTKRGQPFPKNSILHILHSEKYTGIYCADGKVYTNLYPRIISDELFNIVRKIADKNRYGKVPRTEPYILRKLVVCGYCGSPINGDSATGRNGERRHYYNCNGKKYKHTCKKIAIKKNVLEKLVIDTTIRVLSSSHIISKIAEIVMKRHNNNLQNDSQIHYLTEERDKVKLSIDNIVSAIEQGIITASTKKRLTELELILDEIQNKIRIAQGKKLEEIKKEDIIYYIKTCLSKEPQQMIKMLVDKIILYDDKIEIFYKFNKRSPDNESRDFLFYTEETIPAREYLHYRELVFNTFIISLFC
ncbi:MAG: recombinase family protein [Clostridia bacterium]|nr:recombinase family protein [Clostridia bacterium]